MAFKRDMNRDYALYGIENSLGMIDSWVRDQEKLDEAKKNSRYPSKKKQDRVWTPEELKYLKDHRKTETCEEIGKKLGRSRGSVSGKLSRMGWIRPKSKGKANLNPEECITRTSEIPWTSDEDNYLKENFNKIDHEILAVNLGRALDDMYIRAYTLGLNKDELIKYRDSMKWEVIEGEKTPIQLQFDFTKVPEPVEAEKIEEKKKTEEMKEELPEEKKTINLFTELKLPLWVWLALTGILISTVLSFLSFIIVVLK